jgi:hypothetical protein
MNTLKAHRIGDIIVTDLLKALSYGARETRCYVNSSNKHAAKNTGTVFSM